LRSPAPGLIRISRSQIARELTNIPLGREYSDTFTFDDPSPAFHEAVRLARGLLRRQLDRAALTRTLHKQRHHRRVRAARSVLFVCYGNICRSPFAEMIARTRLDARITSAGIHERNGRSSPDTAVRAACNAGVDLSGHRSCVLTRQMLDSADVIFVFDRTNEQAIRALDGNAGQKTVLLGAFGHSLEIRDPYGGDLDEFARCYREIAVCIDHVARLRLGSEA
jgi:protein-tyrosine-phosphatase